MRTIPLAALVVMLVLVGCGQQSECPDSQQAGGGVPVADTPADGEAPEEYGARAALASEAEPTLERMLTWAIQDEYLAEAEYLDVLARHGDVMPFSNIVHAERRHIEAIESLFDSCATPVPPNHASKFVVPTQSVAEAVEACIEGEVLNIGMYDLFLGRELPANVRDVFENLKAASQQHLEAFRRHQAGE